MRRFPSIAPWAYRENSSVTHTTFLRLPSSISFSACIFADRISPAARIIKTRMSAHEANNPFDLLRLNPPPPPAVKLHGAAEPQLGIGWGDFHQGVFSNFAELFRRTHISKSLLSAAFFKDLWIEHP